MIPITRWLISSLIEILRVSRFLISPEREWIVYITQSVLRKNSKRRSFTKALMSTKSLNSSKEWRRLSLNRRTEKFGKSRSPWERQETRQLPRRTGLRLSALLIRFKPDLVFTIASTCTIGDQLNLAGKLRLIQYAETCPQQRMEPISWTSLPRCQRNSLSCTQHASTHILLRMHKEQRHKPIWSLLLNNWISRHC